MAGTEERWDYIIIGAGSAGCVLANRLSADPAIKVLLLEAGGKDSSPLIRMPAGVGNLLKAKGPHNWGFETVPQAAMDGRRMWWPRGKGWGGSSSINGMIYIRGHARDYDQWRQMGLEGWGYRDVLPYFRRSETLESGADAWHGGEGPLHVSVGKSPNPLWDAFIEAGRQAGYPVTSDFNGARQEGMGRYQLTIKDGERWSASFAYLRPIVGVRPNLEARTKVQVARILIEGGRAVGVEYLTKKGGLPVRVRCEREVLLCAGATQTPAILEMSGIGDPEQLKRIGVPVKVASPGVGANLQDHLDVIVSNVCREPITAYSARKGLKQYLIGLDYLIRKQGMGRENLLETGAFLKSRPELDRPDLQLHFVLAIMEDHAKTEVEKDGFSTHVCQLRPESRGTTHAASTDPYADPLIDPNYLAAEEDRRTLRQGVKMVREIHAQAAMARFAGEEHAPGAGVNTDAEIDAFIRRKGETIYHPVGTARMGADEASVVDPMLRVRGVEGLRVVDASVMPTLVSGNTNAPTIMIAEKASDLILGKALMAPEDAPVWDDESQRAA